MLPTAALASVPAPAATPAERLQAAIDQLQFAATDALPEIDNWRIGLGHDGGCPAVVQFAQSSGCSHEAAGACFLVPVAAGDLGAVRELSGRPTLRLYGL